MEGYIAAIWMFGGNFAPRNWAFCQNQLIAISSNTALFSLLGTTYGGNGTTTFALPDLRGRVPVGTGQGPGLQYVNLGEIAGTPSVTLISSQMPAHNHNLFATTIPGTTGTPAGNVMVASPLAAGRPVNAFAAPGATTTLNPASIGVSGGSQPHENMQPYLGMNYVICMFGIFPSRN